ncbi:MAG: HPr family phosphocarrier protein [Syntrophales bacterium LBB04]|nr:HPr family phosphocarrier protein [Syntrophales bacterium LBB04]
MVEIKTFEIKNKLGLHARPAAKLVNVSTKYKADIYFEMNGQQANAKSMLSVLTMACPKGSMMTIRAEGRDALAAVEALGKVIEEKFGED